MPSCILDRIDFGVQLHYQFLNAWLAADGGVYIVGELPQCFGAQPGSTAGEGDTVVERIQEAKSGS